MNLEHENDTFQVHWSEEDLAYVGVCTEFPSLSWLDTSSTAALAGIRALVSDIVADLKDNQESVPSSLS